MSDLLSRLSERALGLRSPVAPLLRAGSNRTPIATEDIVGAESYESVVQSRPTDRRSREMASDGPAPATEAHSQRTLTTVHDIIEKMYSVAGTAAMQNAASEQRTPTPQPSRSVRGITQEPIHSSVYEAASEAHLLREDIDHPESSMASALVNAQAKQTDRRWKMEHPSLLSTAPHASRDSDPALPALQVTIGRIDLHAAPPAARPTAAPVPKPGTLSIEDYLAHRRGGRS